ncbi:MAG: hypothetical protein ABJN34_17655 [Litoreibacter sp.]|uniref:hypothetical protein n=1 Tax=Litoreibacter sp. TaxID=1969459 RepID=UPI003298A3AB
MSIKKLLGTGACMVIIGASAGASYSLIQGLTQQDLATEVAYAAPSQIEAEAPDTAPENFVAASVTTWTPLEESNVGVPELKNPSALLEPNPTQLRYSSTNTDAALHIAPALPLFAHIDETVVATPKIEVPATRPVAKAAKIHRTPKQISPVAREIKVASAPRSIVTPGTLRRFRGTNEAQTQNPNHNDRSSVLEQIFPQKTKLKPQQSRRPTTSRTVDAVRRNVRFRQTWSTGVYR